MADITKCPGYDCPFKERCTRFTAEPSEYQSYFLEPPIKEGKCDMYWGEDAEFIWNQLKEITNEKKDS